MGIQRLENVGIIVADLEAATAFFVQLGLTVVQEASVEGTWVDRVLRLDGVQADIVMLQTPDGHGRLELSTYRTPAARTVDPYPLPNTLGLHRVAFGVDDIDATVAGLLDRGSALIGEVVRFEDSYRLCYVRGPEGIIVMLAEELG